MRHGPAHGPSVAWLAQDQAAAAEDLLTGMHTQASAYLDAVFRNYGWYSQAMSAISQKGKQVKFQWPAAAVSLEAVNAEEKVIQTACRCLRGPPGVPGGEVAARLLPGVLRLAHARSKAHAEKARKKGDQEARVQALVAYASSAQEAEAWAIAEGCHEAMVATIGAAKEEAKSWSKEVYGKQLEELAAKADRAACRATLKALDISGMDVGPDLLTKVYSDEAKHLKEHWETFKDSLAPVTAMGKALGVAGEPAFEPIQEKLEINIACIKTHLSNLVASRALYRGLKKREGGQEQRSDVAAAAQETIRLLGGDLDPRLSLALEAAASPPEGGEAAE